MNELNHLIGVVISGLLLAPAFALSATRLYAYWRAWQDGRDFHACWQDYKQWQWANTALLFVAWCMALLF